MSDGKAKDSGESSGSVFALGGIGGCGCVPGTLLYVYFLLNDFLLFFFLSARCSCLGD
jgi:hypothetical protein